MRETTRTITQKPSALVRIRQLLPDGYQASFPELLSILERQALCLLRLSGYDPEQRVDVNTDLIHLFPRIRIVPTDKLSTSGASIWNGSEWLVFINRHEATTRQRFTLFHELAHIIQHGNTGNLFQGRDWLPESLRQQDAKRQCERAADYFAACVLMPKSAVSLLWQRGIHTPEILATHLNVSPKAMRIRLEQLGLTPQNWLCNRGHGLHAVDPLTIQTETSFPPNQHYVPLEGA